jgi:hypothetical protein
VVVGIIAAACSLATTASPAAGAVCAEVPGPHPGCVVRPHGMAYGAHASIYGIKWRSWGSDRAVGEGHILWRRTVTEPRFGPYRAKLILSAPAECGHRNVYSFWTLKIREQGHWKTLDREEPLGNCFG